MKEDRITRIQKAMNNEQLDKAMEGYGQEASTRHPALQKNADFKASIVPAPKMDKRTPRGGGECSRRAALSIKRRAAKSPGRCVLLPARAGFQRPRFAG